MLAENENDIRVIENKISFINLVRAIIQASALMLLAASGNIYIIIVALLLAGARFAEASINCAYSLKAMVASTLPLAITMILGIVSLSFRMDITTGWISILAVGIFAYSTYLSVHKLYHTFYNNFLQEENYEIQSIELQDSFQRFEEETALRFSIEQASNTGIFKWHFDSNYSLWSSGVFKALGITQNIKPLNKYEFMRRVDYHHRIRFHEAFEKANMGEKAEFEFSFCSDKGQKQYISCSAMPIFNKDQMVIGVQGLLVDQTRLVNILDELKLASRVKSEFLANMSHEIRTPLNGVIAIASLLAKTELTNEQKEMVSIIENSGDSLKTILNDVLDLARVESGRLEIEHIKFNLAENINAVASLFSFKATEKSIGFFTDIDEASNQNFIGDPNRIKQIVSNFLSNAIKFTDEGEVRLEARINNKDNNNILELVVKDSGCGIDKEKINKLFNRFEQIDGSITRQYGGSGLGLAISKALTDLMGGEIRVESKIGEGTRFSLIMPLVMVENDANNYNDVDEDAEVSVTNMSILAAEDNPTNLQVLSMILSQFDCDLTLVENGKDALDAFKTKKFDLVLMDVQMPIMDGLTSIKLMREYEKEINSQKTPIIVLSANAMTHHITEAIQVGATLHVSKPFTPNSLIEGIETALITNEKNIAA